MNATTTESPAASSSGRLTAVQFLRSLALARAYGHGWAEQFDRLGLDPAGRNDSLVSPQELTSEPPAVVARLLRREDGWVERWRLERERKLDGCSTEESALVDAIEASLAAGAAVSVDDVRRVALIGSSWWDPLATIGIWSPTINESGEAEHVTTTGRLAWQVDRDGGVRLQILRPVPPEPLPLFICDVEVEERSESYGHLSLPCHGDEPESHAMAERLDEVRAIIPSGWEAEWSGGGNVTVGWLGVRLTARFVPGLVLWADVRPDGTTRVTRHDDSGVAVHLRHVLALEKALRALGVNWDPRLSPGPM